MTSMQEVLRTDAEIVSLYSRWWYNFSHDIGQDFLSVLPTLYALNTIVDTAKEEHTATSRLSKSYIWQIYY